MQTSSPFPSASGLPSCGIDVHRHAEAGRLDLALPHRRGRIAEHEARHDVGAARDRRQMHVGFDVAVDVFEALRRERRTGGRDHPQRRKVMGARRRNAGLAAGVDVFRRGPEHGDALVLRIVPERGRRRRERRAVVEHQRRAGAEAGDQPVPHHPAERGEIEQPLARAQVALQAMLLEVLEQRAAGAVHDAFRHAGRARREQDVDRVIERQPLEGERLGRERLEERGEARGARQFPRHRLGLAEIVDDDDVPRRRKLVDDRLQLVQKPDRLAVVPIAVDRHEHLGLDLPEAVEHAALAEVGRAGRPDRADRGRRQHQRDRVRTVRQHGGDAVADADAGRAQCLLHPRDQRVQFGPGQAAL